MPKYIQGTEKAYLTYRQAYGMGTVAETLSLISAKDWLHLPSSSTSAVNVLREAEVTKSKAPQPSGSDAGMGAQNYAEHSAVRSSAQASTRIVVCPKPPKPPFGRREVKYGVGSGRSRQRLYIRKSQSHEKNSVGCRGQWVFYELSLSNAGLQRKKYQIGEPTKMLLGF